MATGLLAAGIVVAGFAIEALRPPPPPPPPAPIPASAPEPLPGAITFEIKPEGEVYVDGALKGKSPPLKKIQVPAGDHVIEIRHGTYKPLVTELVVGQGEEFEVTHNFVVAQPPKPPVKTKVAPPKPRPQPKQAPPKEQKEQKEKGAWQRFLDWLDSK